MSQLTRAFQKIFGSTGGSSEFGKIGSKAAGSPATTKDLELIQSLSEYLLGLNAIVSDQGTSVLPYLEDMNSLFFLTTSQIAYLMQSGVPEWNAETEYYQEVSVAVDEGMIWKDIFGTGGTPNLNFQPSLNQDKWQPIAPAVKKQTIAASGALTLGFSNHKIEADTSGGDINISTLPVPKFQGQKLHVYVNGSNNAFIASGTGVLTNITISQNSIGAFFESVNFGGSLEWRVINEQQKAVDFESKDLVLSLLTTETVGMIAKSLTTLDSNSIPTFLSDIDEIFDTTTDTVGGLAPISSVRYDLFIDSNRVKIMAPRLPGTADADVLNSLSDSLASFQTNLVPVGSRIEQTTDDTEGFVKAVSSENVITIKDKDDVDLDLFPLGTETYIIHMLSPPGLGDSKANVGSTFNNSSSDLVSVLKKGQARITTAHWHTLNGTGSSSTKIPKWSVEIEESNNEVGIINMSATLGLVVTPKMNCKCEIGYTGIFSGGDWGGISKNSTQLTSNIFDITDADVLTMNRSNAANDGIPINWSGILEKEDKIRPHFAGGEGANLDRSHISIKLTEII